MYNHVYFSDLDFEYKRALLTTKGYRRIAQHSNYNPRIVEHMTMSRYVTGLTPTEYVKTFVSSLENPIRIWRHAFEEQLSASSRELLLILASFPNEALITDIQLAYEQYTKLRSVRRNSTLQLEDFDRAIKESEGNFLRTYRVGEDLLIAFHNPSIEDFLRQHLSGRPIEVLDLLDSAVFFEQCVNLSRGKKESASRAAIKNVEALDRAIRRLFKAETCRVIRQGNGEHVTGVKHWQPSAIERATSVFEIAQLLGCSLLHELAGQLVRALTPTVKTRQTDSSGLTGLARAIVKKAERTEVEATFVSAVKAALLAETEEIDDFRAIAHLVDADQTVFSPEELTALGERFVEFCRIQARQAVDEDDSDELYSAAYALNYIGQQLGVQARTQPFTEAIESRANDISSRNADEDSEPEEDWQDEKGTQQEFDMDQMFQGLLHELEILHTAPRSRKSRAVSPEGVVTEA